MKHILKQNRPYFINKCFIRYVKYYNLHNSFKTSIHMAPLNIEQTIK